MPMGSVPQTRLLINAGLSLRGSASVNNAFALGQPCASDKEGGAHDALGVGAGGGGGAEGDCQSGCKHGYGRLDKRLRGRHGQLNNCWRAAGSSQRQLERNGPTA